MFNKHKGEQQVSYWHEIFTDESIQVLLLSLYFRRSWAAGRGIWKGAGGKVPCEDEKILEGLENLEVLEDVGNLGDLEQLEGLEYHSEILVSPTGK